MLRLASLSVRLGALLVEVEGSLPYAESEAELRLVVSGLESLEWLRPGIRHLDFFS